MPKLTLRILLVALSVVALSGCYKNPTIVIPPGSAPQFFVADVNKGLVTYSQPLSAGSAPTSSIVSVAPALGLAVDGASNLYVSTGIPNGTVSVFRTPITASSTAASVIGPIVGSSAPAGLAFDQSGGLWVADNGHPNVYYFNPPAGAVPTKTLTALSLTNPFGVVVDSVGNLIVGDFSSATLQVFSPPLNNGANVAVAIITLPSQGAGVSINPGGAGCACKDWLFVGLGDGRIAVYKPPFATGNLPAFFIAAPTINGGTTSETGAGVFDASGNFYEAYGNFGGPNTGVAVYLPPFSGSSIPSFVFNGGLTWAADTAIGP